MEEAVAHATIVTKVDIWQETVQRVIVETDVVVVGDLEAEVAVEGTCLATTVTKKVTWREIAQNQIVEIAKLHKI